MIKIYVDHKKDNKTIIMVIDHDMILHSEVVYTWESKSKLDILTEEFSDTGRKIEIIKR